MFVLLPVSASCLRSNSSWKPSLCFCSIVIQQAATIPEGIGTTATEVTNRVFVGGIAYTVSRVANAGNEKRFNRERTTLSTENTFNFSSVDPNRSEMRKLWRLCLGLLLKPSTVNQLFFYCRGCAFSWNDPIAKRRERQRKLRVVRNKFWSQPTPRGFFAWHVLAGWKDRRPKKRTKSGSRYQKMYFCLKRFTCRFTWKIVFTSGPDFGSMHVGMDRNRAKPTKWRTGSGRRCVGGSRRMVDWPSNAIVFAAAHAGRQRLPDHAEHISAGWKENYCNPFGALSSKMLGPGSFASPGYAFQPG